MKSGFKRNKGVLPSFRHPLVTGDRSTQTHPALLWSLRKRESSRLKNKQQRAFFSTRWLMTGRAPSASYLRCICISSNAHGNSAPLRLISTRCAETRDAISACEVSGYTVYCWPGAFGCHGSQLFTSGGSESVLNQYIRWFTHRTSNHGFITLRVPVDAVLKCVACRRMSASRHSNTQWRYRFYNAFVRDDISPPWRL